MSRTQGEAEAILRRISDLDCFWGAVCLDAVGEDPVCERCQAKRFLERPKRDRGFASIVWNRDGWQTIERAIAAVKKEAQRFDMSNPRAVELMAADWLSGRES